MNMLELDTQHAHPLIEQIVSGVQQQIEARILRPGTRLPSIRGFADRHKVSRFTVVQAYDRLVATGYVQSRKGSGFYVAPPTPPAAPEPAACNLKRAVDVLWMLHKTLEDTPLHSLPGCGWLPAEWLDGSALQRGLRTLARLPVEPLVHYGNAYGYPPLRQDFQQRLLEAGVTADLNQIVTTHGVSHALDLVARYLVRPGDAVLVDDPGYFNLFGHLKTLGAQLVGVPRGLDGPDVAALEALVIEHKPKVFFTNTVLHNPTTVSISQACAFRVLQLAAKHDFLIVEDDIYADLHSAPATRLATLDGLERVIYVSSFSKTISASLRAGFIACRPELARALVDLKILTGLTTSEIGERLLHQVLAEGHYRKYLERLRVRLQAARERTLTRLERAGLALYVEPTHGMFVWARLPGCTLDSAQLADVATEQGIMLAPGTIFRPYQESSPWLRFNVAFCDDPALFTFLERANG